MTQPRPSTLADQDAAFRRYYQRHLQPLEAHFEALRRKAARELVLRILFSVLAWLAALSSIVYLADPIGEFWPFVVFFALASAIMLGVWAWLPAGVHQLRLKDQVLTRIVPFFGDLHYQAEPNVLLSSYSDWLILPNFNKSHCEDLIQGVYHRVPLKLAEVRLDYTYRSGRDSSSTRTALKGLWVEFKLDERFAGVTFVRTVGSDMNGQFRINDRLKKKTQNTDFEVFATEGAPGTRLVDTRMLNRLTKIVTLFEAKQLFASFHHDKLVMLIEHKGDYFEMSHWQKTDFIKDAERIRDQLSHFFALVDLLELRSNAESPAHPSEPSFPDIKPKQRDSTEAYDVGGWGCLSAFVLFAVAMSVFLWILDSELSKGEQLGWATLGGFLSLIGFWQLVKGVTQGALGRLIIGLIFTGLALGLGYHFSTPEIQQWVHLTLPFVEQWLEDVPN